MGRFDEADDLFATGWEVAERPRGGMTLTYLALSGPGATAGEAVWPKPTRRSATGRHPGRGSGSGRQAGLEHHLAMLALEEGDAATALKAEAGKAEPLVSAQAPSVRAQLWRVQGELALDAGHTAEAVRLAREMRDLHDRLGILEPCWAPWADTAMVAFLRAGLLDEAQALVEHLDMVTEGLPCRWPRSVAALGRAGLAEAGGALEEAEHHHHQAVHVLDGVGLPLRRARALLIYGRFLRRNGQPVLARGPLSEAIEESEACGGARFAAQARDRAKGKWWAAAPAKFEAIERSGAERDSSGHRWLYQ